MAKRAVTMDKLVALCKARGIIFPGSEIYGGMGNTWDYGPVGVEDQEQLKARMVEALCAGERQLLRRGRRHSHERARLGGERTHGVLLRPQDGLQELQVAVTAPTTSSRRTPRARSIPTS